MSSRIEDAWKAVEAAVADGTFDPVGRNAVYGSAAPQQENPVPAAWKPTTVSGRMSEPGAATFAERFEPLEGASFAGRFEPFEGAKADEPQVWDRLLRTVAKIVQHSVPDMPASGVQEVAKHAVDQFIDMVKTPGRAMQEGITTEQAVPWATNTALNLAGVGTQFAQPGAAGIFGGRLAKTADLAKLKQAEKMAAQGVAREEIWEKTGWFTGADGKWRFEIPDYAATVKPGTGGRVVDKFEHPDLYGAYPDLKETRLAYDQFPKSGSYQEGGSSIPETIGVPMTANPSFGQLGVKEPLNETKDVLLHELTHAIQQREGFAQGTSPFAMRPIARQELQKIIEQDNPEKAKRIFELWDKNKKDPLNLSTAERKELNDLARDYPNPNDIAFKAYERHAGEAEARNVSHRAFFTPEGLKKHPPWIEDVPRDKQIVTGVRTTPVEHDPFAQPRMIPVEHDPFAGGVP